MSNSWKKFILGEKMPDKNDPKYKERYEREVAAGRRFGEAIGLGRLATWLQLFGERHKKSFLGLTVGFIFLMWLSMVSRLTVACVRSQSVKGSSAVERVDSALYQSHRINHR